MTHKLIVPLLLAAAAFVGPFAVPAVAQDAPVAMQADDAEVAFLQAYYLEKGLRDIDAAEKAYAAVALEHAANSSVVAKAGIGQLRCLASLGRVDEGRALQAKLEEQFAGNRSLIAQVRRIDTAPAGTIDAGVFELVMKALLAGGWDKSVPNFGAHAVPTLASTMRTPDPSHVYRAAYSLMLIGDSSACAALANALQDERILFPEQVVRACILARGRSFPDDLGRAIAAFPDAPLRTELLKRAAEPHPSSISDWLVEAIVADARVREIVLEPGNARGIRTRLALRAMGSGDSAARDAGIAFLDTTLGDGIISKWIVAGNPPAGVLTDETALRALVDRVYTRRPDIQPSAALFERVVKEPAYAALAQRWRWFHGMTLPMDPEAFLTSLETDGWDVSDARLYNGKTKSIDVRQTLLNVFAWPPSVDHVRRLTATWPPRLDRAFWTYAETLIDQSSVGEGQIRALYEASPTPALRDLVARGLVSEFDDRKYPSWIADILLSALETSTDKVVRQQATQGLGGARNNGSIDWSRFRERLVPLIENKEFASSLIPLLEACGAEGAEALAAALRPGHPAFQQICDALVRLRQPSSAVALRRNILAPPAGHQEESAERERATFALVKLEGDEAEPTVVAALSASDGVFAKPVFRGVSMAALRLSLPMRARFATRSLEDAPNAIVPSEHVFSILIGMLQRTERDEIAQVAFASPSAAARQWAAHEAETSQSPAFVDPLVGLLSDSSQAVRNAARRALLKYRQIEDDSDWVKSIATRRASAARVDELLASETPRSRMAGIAGLVAHGGADVAARLLEVAAGGPDDDVAAEARRALMALGRVQRTSVEPAPVKKDK